MQKFKDQIDEKYFNFYKIFINRNFQTPIKASNIWQNALSYIQLTSASFPSRVVMRERRILKIIKTKLQRDIKWIKSIISIKLFIVRRCGILTYYDLHLYNLYNGPPPLCLDNYWTLDRSIDSHYVTSLHLRNCIVLFCRLFWLIEMSSHDQLRRGVFLPLYFTVTSLMVSNIELLRSNIFLSSGSPLTLGRLGYLLRARALQVTLPSQWGQKTGGSK